MFLIPIFYFILIKKVYISLRFYIDEYFLFDFTDVFHVKTLMFFKM